MLKLKYDLSTVYGTAGYHDCVFPKDKGTVAIFYHFYDIAYLIFSPGIKSCSAILM